MKNMIVLPHRPARVYSIGFQFVYSIVIRSIFTRDSMFFLFKAFEVFKYHNCLCLVTTVVYGPGLNRARSKV